MTSQPFTRDNLMIHERELHDKVLARAAETGENPKDVLLELCSDAYYGARIAEAMGGPEARCDFRARHIEQKLAEPENQDTSGRLARDMRDGRIGVVRAHHDGHELVEFATGTEVKAACDLQEVGPDPGAMARAQQERQDAAHARLNAEHCADVAAAARWREEADRADQNADRFEAGSMDWLAEPSSIHGFEGPPAAEPDRVQDTAGEPSTAPTRDDSDGVGGVMSTPELVDDGRRYVLTGPRGVDEFLDNLRPDADHHAVTVYGSADLARRVTAAQEAAVCVSWQELDEFGTGMAADPDDNTDGW